MYHRHGTHGPVGGQHRAVPIEYPAPCCLDAPLPLVQIFRQLLIIVRLKDHEPYEPHYQSYQQQYADTKHQAQLFPVVGPAFRFSFFHKNPIIGLLQPIMGFLNLFCLSRGASILWQNRAFIAVQIAGVSLGLHLFLGGHLHGLTGVRIH